MGAVLKSLRDVPDTDLFALVKALTITPERNSWQFLISVASELRQRKLHVTEDYVIKMAAQLAC